MQQQQQICLLLSHWVISQSRAMDVLNFDSQMWRFHTRLPILILRCQSSASLTSRKTEGDTAKPIRKFSLAVYTESWRRLKKRWSQSRGCFLVSDLAVPVRLSQMYSSEGLQFPAPSPNLSAMCEKKVFAHRLLLLLLHMLECVCKYLVNRAQHILWLCLRYTHILAYTVWLWFHAV